MKISALYLSPGHNFVGRHGLAPGGYPAVSVDAVECPAGRGGRRGAPVTT